MKRFVILWLIRNYPSWMSRTVVTPWRDHGAEFLYVIVPQLIQKMQERHWVSGLVRRMTTWTVTLMLTSCLSGCAVGPNYARPTVTIPTQYKEISGTSQWKVAKPRDTESHSAWWQIFHDPELNNLEARLNRNNQTIAIAAAQYRQARALVDEARADFFPTISTGVQVFLQKSSGFNGSSSSANSVSSGDNATASHTLTLDASWEPDIWGGTRRTVEARRANSDASQAQLAFMRLSQQATLAQLYFELRALDTDQQLLDKTVADYKKALKITQNRYQVGVAGKVDMVQAQGQLDSAQAAAIHNGIRRAQFEHAIATLIGEPPANFTLAHQPLKTLPPPIPISVPSELLERRPDIARAERLVAQANAQIGVATAAYFPNLLLSGNVNDSSQWRQTWFSFPTLAWSVGAQLAQTLFDGGLRRATTAAARANYEATVANYRQTVLAAFQEVEDNLAALRILSIEATALNQAAANTKQALQLVINQYKAGTVAYSNVIAAQIIAFTAEKNAVDITGLRMSAAVALIKSLGGGWDIRNR